MRMSPSSVHTLPLLTAAVLAVLLAPALQAQFLADNNRSSDRMAPRLPDGTLSLSGPPDEIGNWEGNAGAVLFLNERPGAIDNPAPSWFGHSVGRWENATLVIDSVGFNDKFWLTREGVPHTTRLHLTERFTRTNFHTLEYLVTVDDPGAYTAPWSGGWYINWVPDNEPFDYLCQENNRDGAMMIGPEGL